jgi:hypothetical protein
VVSDSLIDKDQNRTIFFNNYQITSISGLSSEKFVTKLYDEIRENDPELLTENVTNATIFISYASEDFRIVKKIYSQLKENRIDAWFDDREIAEGEIIKGEIKDGIDRSCVFIPIISENSRMGDKRRHYQLEWDYAIDKEKRGDLEIIPLIIDDTNNDALDIREEFRIKHIPRLEKNNNVSEKLILRLKEIQTKKRNS